MNNIACYTFIAHPWKIKLICNANQLGQLLNVNTDERTEFNWLKKSPGFFGFLFLAIAYCIAQRLSEVTEQLARRPLRKESIKACYDLYIHFLQKQGLA